MMTKRNRGAPRKPKKGTLARFLKDRPRDWPVYEFVRDRVAAQGGKWGSKEAAIEAAQAKFGIARKTVQRKYADMKVWADIGAEIAKTTQHALANFSHQMSQISDEAHDMLADLENRLAAAEFTPSERFELEHVGVPLALKIADAFVELKRLRVKSGRAKQRRRIK